MQEQNAVSQSLSEAVDIGYLDLSQAEFYNAPGGFTGLRYKGEDYKRVALRRALPIGDPESYISVADPENKEIGILRSVQDIADEQRRIVKNELDRRYYCPTVLQVKSVKDKMGYVYMELTVRGDGQTYEKNCAVKDVNRNIRMLDDDRLLLFDVDGNRYLIESLRGLDKKSVKQLEPYLF